MINNISTIIPDIKIQKIDIKDGIDSEIPLSNSNDLELWLLDNGIVIEKESEGSKLPDSPLVGIFVLLIPGKNISLIKKTSYVRNAKYNSNGDIYTDLHKFRDIVPNFTSTMVHGIIGYRIENIKNSNNKAIRFLLLTKKDWINDQLIKIIKNAFHLNGIKLNAIPIK